MRDVDAAYIAGFMDGEGTITICRRTKSNSYSSSVSLANNNRAIIEYIKSLLEGNCYIRVHKRKYGIYFSLQFAKRHAKYLFERIYPFIQIKKHNIEILYEFWKVAENHKYSQERKDKLEELRQDIKFLNRRGIIGEEFREPRIKGGSCGV